MKTQRREVRIKSTFGNREKDNRNSHNTTSWRTETDREFFINNTRDPPRALNTLISVFVRTHRERYRDKALIEQDEVRDRPYLENHGTSEETEGTHVFRTIRRVTRDSVETF